MTSTEVRERIAEAYRRGEDSPTIAEREGLTPAYICTLAQQAGCEIRGRRKSYTDDEILAVLERFHAEGFWTRDEYEAWRKTQSGWTPSRATMQNRGLWQSRPVAPRVPPLGDLPVETPYGRVHRRYATARWLYTNGMSMTDTAAATGIDIAVLSRRVIPKEGRRPSFRHGRVGTDALMDWVEARVKAGTKVRHGVTTEIVVRDTKVTIRIRQGTKVKTVSVSHEFAPHLRAALNAYYDDSPRPEENT